MNRLKNNFLYVKQFKMKSIFMRTFLLITLLTVVPFLILSIIFYTSTIKNSREEITIENSSMLASSANIIDETLMECDMMNSSLASNESVQIFMINNLSTESFRAVYKLTKTLPIVYKYIDSVYIYSEDSNSIIVNDNIVKLPDFADNDWIDSYNSVNTQKGVIVPRSKNNTYPHIITIIKPIYVSNEKKGAVIMNINSQTLYSSMLYKQYKNGRIFLLVNPDNKIIMSNDSDYFNKQPEDIGCGDINSKSYSCVINGSKYTLLSLDSRVADYKYISGYPLTIYDRQLSTLRMQIILICLLLLAVVFVLAYVASVKSYTPLNRIISFLDNSAESISSDIEDKDELMYIINSIRLHIEDKTKMEEILEERMKLLKKAQYDMLQTQINPHFLYNTLETINWMAYNLSNSENPVSKSLINLANFFRNTLSSGYFVSIEDEIKHTKEYVNIFALTYGDLFDIEWNIDDAILSCTIIKICLQPLIENAVYHGIKPKNDKGFIKISGLCSNETITLIVSDNGVGMSAEAVELLNANLSDMDYSDEKSHIGLSNVNQRIKIIFGDAYGISVKSQKNVFTEIRVKIPREKYSPPKLN